MDNIYSFIDENTLSIENIGTLPTPCILTLVPMDNIQSIVITGLSDNDIKLSSLKAGSTYIIDGENGIITENGVNNITKYNGWTLPYLKPGKNIIKITNLPQLTGTFSFTPRY